jgi:hypothetical protein
MYLSYRPWITFGCPCRSSRRALADRLAADKSGRVISTSDTMRRTLAILGSGIFLVIAPGIVAGYVPWRICRWHVGAPLLGISPFRVLGVLLVAAGLPVLLDSFARFALQGLGTPAPIFPTRHLVVSGLGG